MVLENPLAVLQVHRQYQLFNAATKQEARFEVLDLYQYAGQYVVYGERMRQGIWVPSTIGRVQAPPGPACFPIFPTELGVDIMRLMEHLRSLPLYLVLANGSLLPVLSLEDGCKILGGEKDNRDAMVRRAQQLVDLYLQWKPTKVLPQWFLARQRLAKSLN